MGLGRFLHSHDERPDAGGVIERARAYEVATAIAFGGMRRRLYGRLAARSGAGLGDRVLDVGCGTGALTRALAARVGPVGEATGLDASEPMIAYARRHAPGSYVLGQAQDLPFDDDTFDVVTSAYAVHHVPAAARATAFSEMFRVLRPGGRLLIADFRPPEGRLATHVTSALAGPAMARNPIGEFADLIAGAGFTIEDDGDQWPLLHYTCAARPGEHPSERPARTGPRAR
ncbi:hypothetical protein GCM10029978_007590 [Actinoallomurus acanthiterrae]